MDDIWLTGALSRPPTPNTAWSGGSLFLRASDRRLLESSRDDRSLGDSTDKASPAKGADSDDSDDSPGTPSIPRTLSDDSYFMLYERRSKAPTSFVL
jgi:hypothetical protein